MGRPAPARSRTATPRACSASSSGASPPTVSVPGAMLAPDAHLRRADPVLARLIDDYGGPLPEEPDFRGRPDDKYGALVRGITGQQLSVKAAASIWPRVLQRYGGTTPTPAQSLADDPDELRVAAGFSHAKVRYLRSLAERIESGELHLSRLPDLPAGEVTRE